MDRRESSKIVHRSERISGRENLARRAGPDQEMSSRSAPQCLAIALAAVVLPAAAQVNPLARPARADPMALDGRWNGADIERRSNCLHPENDGQHGTYAEYDFAVDTANRFLSVAQFGVTGINCSWGGNYQADAFHIDWSGNYNCTDGKSGSFRSKSFLLTPNAMSIRLDIKLSGSEVCDIDSILGGSRF